MVQGKGCREGIFGGKKRQFPLDFPESNLLRYKTKFPWSSIYMRQWSFSLWEMGRQKTQWSQVIGIGYACRSTSSFNFKGMYAASTRKDSAHIDGGWWSHPIQGASKNQFWTIQLAIAPHIRPIWAQHSVMFCSKSAPKKTCYYVALPLWFPELEWYILTQTHWGWALVTFLFDNKPLMVHGSPFTSPFVMLQIQYHWTNILQPIRILWIWWSNWSVGLPKAQNPKFYDQNSHFW